jgi:diguanylate cyclase (GGDEF)-like protein
LGGDEFLIVFIGLNSNGAESVWERIAEELNNWNIKFPRKYIASASHGIVGFDSDHLRTLDELIKDADERMYLEKGRKKRTHTESHKNFEVTSSN